MDRLSASGIADDKGAGQTHLELRCTQNVAACGTELSALDSADGALKYGLGLVFGDNLIGAINLNLFDQGIGDHGGQSWLKSQVFKGRYREFSDAREMLGFLATELVSCTAGEQKAEAEGEQ